MFLKSDFVLQVIKILLHLCSFGLVRFIVMNSNMEHGKLQYSLIKFNIHFNIKCKEMLAGKFTCQDKSCFHNTAIMLLIIKQILFRKKKFLGDLSL